MFRSDGFKKVVKGLSYKRTSTTLIRPNQQSYTSMGKRTPMMHYEIGTKDNNTYYENYNSQNNKDDQFNNVNINNNNSNHLLNSNKSTTNLDNQFKRTKTADFMQRNKKNTTILDSREKMFI